MIAYRCKVRCQWRGQLWTVGDVVECGEGETPTLLFFERVETATEEKAEFVDATPPTAPEGPGPVVTTEPETSSEPKPARTRKKKE